MRFYACGLIHASMPISWYLNLRSLSLPRSVCHLCYVSVACFLLFLANCYVYVMYGSPQICLSSCWLNAGWKKRNAEAARLMIFIPANTMLVYIASALVCLLSFYVKYVFSCLLLAWCLCVCLGICVARWYCIGSYAVRPINPFTALHVGQIVAWPT